MFIFEILIYVFFAWVMYKFAYNANTFPIGSKLQKKFIWYFIAFFTFICAIRWNVGTDSVAYIRTFDLGLINEDNERNEYLFRLLVEYSHKLGIHYTIGIGILAFLQILFIVKSIKEYPYILIFLPIVLFGGSYFGDFNNAVRQMIAASMFLYASRFITDKKPIPYFAILFFASLFHHSAYMMMPLYLLGYMPIKYFDISRKRNLLMVILIVCFILGQIPFLQRYLNSMEFLSQQFGYEDYTERLSRLTSSQYREEQKAFGPMQLSYLITAMALTWFGPMLKRHFGNRIKYFDLWYLLGYLYGAIFFLVCNSSHIFIRPIMYFLPFQLIIVSLMLYCFYKSNLKVHMLIIIIIIWMSTCWNVIKNIDVEWEPVTYKIVLFHDIHDWK